MITLTLNVMMLLAIVGVVITLILSKAVSYAAPYGLAIYLVCTNVGKLMSAFGISFENEILYVVVYGASIAVTVFVMRQIHKVINKKIELVRDVSPAMRD